VREEVAAVAALAAHRGDAKGSKLTARGGAGWDTGWGGCWDGVGIRGEYGEEEREKDKRRPHDDDCLCFCFVHWTMCRALRSQCGFKNWIPLKRDIIPRNERAAFCTFFC
jgi:hypothetical protein